MRLFHGLIPFVTGSAALILLGQAPATPETPAAPEITYSSPEIDKTPVGAIPFHGPFGRETLYATAHNLPPHQFLEVSVEVFILRTWDGSVAVTSADEKPQPLGPDYLRIALRGGPTLLYTTFSNMPDDPGFHGESKSQNYPSQVPGDVFLPETGASAKNSLGYNYPDPGPPHLFPMDATYRLRFVVPQKEDQAVVEMTGINLQDLHDESWGVARVSVKPLAADQVKKPSVEAIQRAFEDSLDVQADHAAAAVDEFQTLISGMDDTVAWIEKNVKPQAVDAAQVASLIADITGDDSKIDARDAAHKALVDMGPAVEPALRDARRTAGGEQRLRIDWALATLGVRRPEEPVRRVALATRVLEIIGTPKALELRKHLTLRETPQ